MIDASGYSDPAKQVYSRQLQRAEGRAPTITWAHDVAMDVELALLGVYMSTSDAVEVVTHLSWGRDD